MIADLKYAGIPFLGLLAVHYWFVVRDNEGTCERWEVWQRTNVGGKSVGHVYRNLMSTDSNVGGGPTHLATQWTDADAVRIAKVLRESWDRYPYCHWYRMMPGPNSNTFVAWVLAQAGINYELSHRGIGKNFLR